MIAQVCRFTIKVAILLVLLKAGHVATTFALEARELLLIVNRNVPEGVELAEYYRHQRQIPVKNLLKVSVSAEEHCSRMEYEQQLAGPLRQWLAAHPQNEIRGVLLFYGIPLKIADLQEEDRGAVSNNGRVPGDARTGAAVDSEIALVQWGDYPLEGWIANPLFRQRSTRILNRKGPDLLMVSRLDASSPDIVRRMIDDSLAAEKQGLDGTAYFDARWRLPEDDAGLSAYAFYDRALHRAADLAADISRLHVVLDEQEALLASADKAALYSGWYQLGTYADVFAWQAGAVGYHIASSECTTLKNPQGQGWCKRILEEGAAATLGPVSEPYLQAFPPPDMFSAYLLDGYYSLVESYFLSLPYLSWQMLLIGDPLYRPFRY